MICVMRGRIRNGCRPKSRLTVNAAAACWPMRRFLCAPPPSSPVGMHRVVDPAGAALPQAARVLDAGGDLWPDEVRIDVETLNLDAASFLAS